MCLSLHDHTLKVCERNIIETTWGNFTNNLGAVEDKGELIRFQGQKIKGPGHNKNKYGKKNSCLKMHLSNKGTVNSSACRPTGS